MATIDVENVLGEMGFTVLSKIFTENRNGTMGDRYVKAVDPMGYKIFILLDIDGDVRINPNDLRVQERTNAIHIPNSVQGGSFQCVGSELCGVAFDCDKGLCVINRSTESAKPIIGEFVYNTVLGVEGSARDSIDHLSYPVVRYSELLINQDDVQQATIQLTHQLRNRMAEMCHNTLSQTEEEGKIFSKNLIAFLKIHRNLIAELKKEYIALRKEFNQAETLEEQRLTARKIRAINEIDGEVVKACQRLTRVRGEMAKLNDEVVECGLMFKKFTQQK